MAPGKDLPVTTPSKDNTDSKDSKDKMKLFLTGIPKSMPIQHLKKLLEKSAQGEVKVWTLTSNSKLVCESGRAGCVVQNLSKKNQLVKMKVIHTKFMQTMAHIRVREWAPKAKHQRSQQQTSELLNANSTTPSPDGIAKWRNEAPHYSGTDAVLFPVQKRKKRKKKQKEQSYKREMKPMQKHSKIKKSKLPEERAASPGKQHDKREMSPVPKYSEKKKAKLPEKRATSTCKQLDKGSKLAPFEMSDYQVETFNTESLKFVTLDDRSESDEEYPNYVPDESETLGTSDRLFTSMDNESVISLKCEQMDDRSESDEENIYHVADEFEEHPKHNTEKESDILIELTSSDEEHIQVNKTKKRKSLVINSDNEDDIHCPRTYCPAQDLSCGKTCEICGGSVKYLCTDCEDKYFCEECNSRYHARQDRRQHTPALITSGAADKKLKIPETFWNATDTFENEDIVNWYDQKRGKSLAACLEYFSIQNFSSHSSVDSFLNCSYKNSSGNVERFGMTQNGLINKAHAFVALLYRPLHMKNLAAGFYKVSPDIATPQFLIEPKHEARGSVRKWLFSCNVCSGYRDFCKENAINFKHKVIKNLTFEGVRQMQVHQRSLAHKEACYFIEYQAEYENRQANYSKPLKKSKNGNQRLLTDYVKEVVNILKKDRNIHTRRADVLWQKHRSDGKKEYMCEHKSCRAYTTWKLRHPKKHIELVKEANNTVLAAFENIYTEVTINNKKVKINGTIRSQVPQCEGSAYRDGSHPFTCTNCYSHFNYLKMKLEKKKTAAYSVEENRFGKKGMCHKYLTEMELRGVTNNFIKEKKELVKTLRKVSLSRSATSWTERLMDASERDEEEQFLNDLFLAMETDKLKVDSIQFQLMSNLVNKLIKRRNHKYSDIVVNIGRLLCNQVGSTSYQTWENMLGLSSHTTLDRRRRQRKVVPGLMESSFPMAIDLYEEDHPLVATHDEARSLRMLEVMTHPDVPECPILIGDSWSADYRKWPSPEELKIPRQDFNEGDPDDYTAIGRYINKRIGSLAHEVSIHNLYCPTSNKMNPLIFMSIPLPARGFKAANTLQLWQLTRRNCFFDSEGNARTKPLPVCFWSTDAAAPSLSAGKYLMTPNEDLIEKGVSYIGLNLKDEKYKTPFFWKFPSVYFPDPEHLLRLFLRSLKYNTRCLTFSKLNTHTATINHLEKLRHVTTHGNRNALTLKDLILIKYHDQNTNAAEKVFNDEMCNKLRENIGESNGTVLYIKAVCLLMRPCRDSQLDYKEAMISVTAGLYIFRLWKKYLEINSLKLHSLPRANQEPSRRGCFITMACYDCAELMYSGVVGYLLTLFLHFPQQLKKFPINIGTRTTERIISEIQGQTTHNQHMDKQPTYAAMLHRIRGVEENQQILEQLTKAGVKERISNKRREIRRKFSDDKNNGEDEIKFPDSLDLFIEELKAYHKEGQVKAQTLVKELLTDEFVNTLIENEAWHMPYTFNHPASPARGEMRNHPFIEIDFMGIGQEKLDCNEDALISSNGTDVIEEIESFHEPSTSSTQEIPPSITPEINEDIGDGEKNEVWYYTKLENGILNKYHIGKILRSFIPREYVSRERGKRHISAVFLPGMEPTQRDHDVILFHDYVYKDYKNYVHAVNISKIETPTGEAKKSCNSQSNCRFIGKIYEYFDGSLSEEPMLFSKWTSVEKILSEIDIIKGGDNIHEISKSSMEHLQQLGVTNGLFGLYVEKTKRISKPQVEDYYEIDSVKKLRYNKTHHHYECLISFKGYDDSHDSWLPESSLRSPIMIRIQRPSGRISNMCLGGKDASASGKAVVQDEIIQITEEDEDEQTVIPANSKSAKRKSDTFDVETMKKMRFSKCHVVLNKCPIIDNVQEKEKNKNEKKDKEERDQKLDKEERDKKKDNEKRDKKKDKEERYKEIEQEKKDKAERNKKVHQEMKDKEEKDKIIGELPDWPLFLKNMPTGRCYSQEKSIYIKKIEISTTSWNYLTHSKEELDDSVIDAYMQILCSEFVDVFALPSQLLQFWTGGRKCQWSSLNDVDLNSYSFVIMPMIMNHHWTLMVADMKNKIMYLYNSLGPDERLLHRYFNYWKLYLSSKENKYSLEKWQSQHGMSGKQKDSVSCGVFVMMNAEAAIQRENVAEMQQHLVVKYRRYVAHRLWINKDKPRKKKT